MWKVLPAPSRVSTSITASAHSHSVSEKARTLATSALRSRASSPKRDHSALTVTR